MIGWRLFRGVLLLLLLLLLLPLLLLLLMFMVLLLLLLLLLQVVVDRKSRRYRGLIGRDGEGSSGWCDCGVRGLRMGW